MLKGESLRKQETRVFVFSVIDLIWPQIHQSWISPGFKPQNLSGLEMALSLPTYHRSTTQSCLLLSDMSVTNKERKVTESNRHKQSSEKCEGFCGGFSHCFAVCFYHSCSRHSRSSREMGNIKRLCRGLSHESSWQEICLWPSKRDEEVNDSPHCLLCIWRQSLQRKMSAVVSVRLIYYCHQESTSFQCLFSTCVILPGVYQTGQVNLHFQKCFIKNRRQNLQLFAST